MARTPYKWFNINRIGPRKRINGKSGKAETTIFWPHYSGNCRIVGTYSPRKNHGRVTASRQTEKTVDTRHWKVDWLRIHSAKGNVKRSTQWRRKISEWSSAVANPHRGKSTSEWVSECPILLNFPQFCAGPQILHRVADSAQNYARAKFCAESWHP